MVGCFQLTYIDKECAKIDQKCLSFAWCASLAAIKQQDGDVAKKRQVNISFFRCKLSFKLKSQQFYVNLK